MEASKLTVTRYVRGSRMMSILKFLHEKSKKNPRFLKDTTAKDLAHAYVASNPGACATTSAEMAFLKLKNQNFLSNHKRPGTRRSDFRINYLHPALPNELKDEMPQEEADYIARMSARLQEKLNSGEDAKLDLKTGIITTKSSEPEEAPAQTIAKIEANPEPVCSENPEQEPDATNLQPVAIKRDGNSLTLTININLNGMLQ